MDTASPRWSLRLFGDFQLTERVTGEKVALPGKRERVLLAYLALSPNGRQPRRKLVTLLWGEAADEPTLDNLRTSVFNLRKALGDTDRRIIASEDRDIVLDASAFDVDVLALRRLAAAPDVAALEEAAKLYAGDFLDGLSIDSEEFKSWRREESARCKGQVLDALTKLMAQLAASGESERAIDAGLRILRLEPLHEAAVRSLMRLYSGSGRRATAVDLYRTLADSLKKELGAQPEAETRAVYGEIARGGEERPAAPHSSYDQPSPLEGEGGPKVRKGGASANAGLRQATTNRRNWIAAGGLAAAAALAMLLFVTLTPSLDPAPAGAPATVVAATPTSAIALAVLPFANLSSDPEQEFFSDGLTDEIASALAKVPDLRMVARTSAFEFKGQNRNIRTIGEQLGASHLIEGSVRKEGNRVRITAQLIEADSGVHVWNESYDRELTDVFAIQEDIARAIAGALQVPLGLQQGEALVSNRTDDLESYQQYLRARALFRARATHEAIAVLEPALARDPDYAPAWALLAGVYAISPVYEAGLLGGPVEAARRAVQSSFDKAEAAAREAMRLDPRHATGYAALAFVQGHRMNWAAAEDLYRQALALDPDDADILHLYSLTLQNTGRLKESLNVREKLRALEPFVPIYNIIHAATLQLNGQNTAAIQLLEAIPSGGAANHFRNMYLAKAYAAAGRYGDAAGTLLAIPANTISPSRRSVEDAARLLRTAPAKANSPETLPELESHLNFVYALIGAPGRVLDAPERSVEIGYANDGTVRALWDPLYAPVRKTERFKAFARATGYVDYWRAKGWPDLCRPVGADDFVCD